MNDDDDDDDDDNDDHNHRILHNREMSCHVSGSKVNILMLAMNTVCPPKNYNRTFRINNFQSIK